MFAVLRRFNIAMTMWAEYYLLGFDDDEDDDDDDDDDDGGVCSFIYSLQLFSRYLNEYFYLFS